MRLIRAVVGTTAALLAATALAVPARAEPVPPPTVTSIQSLDDATLEVRLEAPDALWVQVTVHDTTAGAPELFRSDDLTFDGAGWHTSAPVQLPAGSAYRDYPVDVDYRLADGTVQHWAAADHPTVSLFRYRLHTSVVSAAYDRSTTDYDHRTATLTGLASTFDPTTRTTSPARAGTAVLVTWTDAAGVLHRATVHTAGDGRFTDTITPNGPARSTTAAVVTPDADTMPGTSATAPDVEVHGQRARILGGPGHVRVHAGQKYTVSGTVQRLTSAGWRALVGAPIVATTQSGDVYYGTSTGTLGSGVTDSAGHYAIRLTAHLPHTVLTYIRSPYENSQTMGDTALAVPRAGSYRNLKFSVDEFEDVHASGALTGSCGGQRVALQYSPNGHTRWQTIGASVLDYQTAGRACHVAVHGYGAASGYYRLAHAESDYLLAVNSGAHKLSRIVTRLTGFSTSPTHPSINGHLTATGRITQRVGGHWSALRNGKVVVVFRLKGDTTWYLGAKVVTNAGGYFRASAKVYGDAAWGAYYSADAKHFYSESEPHNVDAY